MQSLTGCRACLAKSSRENAWPSKSLRLAMQNCRNFWSQMHGCVKCLEAVVHVFNFLVILHGHVYMHYCFIQNVASRSSLDRWMTIASN